MSSLTFTGEVHKYTKLHNTFLASGSCELCCYADPSKYVRFGYSQAGFYTLLVNKCKTNMLISFFKAVVHGCSTFLTSKSSQQGYYANANQYISSNNFLSVCSYIITTIPIFLLKTYPLHICIWKRRNSTLVLVFTASRFCWVIIYRANKSL